MDKIKGGSIIQIEGDDFFNQFMESGDNPLDYQFIIISTDIKTSNQYDNIMVMKQLVPNGYVMEAYLSDNFKLYEYDYKSFISKPELRAMITTILVGAVKHNYNMVLLCSEEEKEYYYLKLIRKFIEKEYGYKTYTYKKFKNALAEGKDLSNDNLDRLRNRLEKEVEYIVSNNIMGGNKSSELDKVRKHLESMELEELQAFCKEKGIKKYKKLSEKKLRKYIMTLIESECL